MTQYRPPAPRARIAVAVALAAALLSAACGSDSFVAEPKDRAMTSVPQPPAFTVQPVVPESQQQAQDTVLDYLRKTVQELPSGTVLDRSRYPGPNNVPCGDDIAGIPDNQFYDMREAKFPPGSDIAALIERTGQIWTGWGWRVVQRDGFRAPNRFGYGPDGYLLQIVAADPLDYPPTIIGSSPCFPGELARSDIALPTVLTAR